MECILEMGPGGAFVYLAHDVAEWPRSEAYGRHDEWDANEEALVSNGQIQDIEVSHRLHLGVTQYDIDDERVAQQPDDENSPIKTLHGNR